jgi:hypothetical protein
MIPYEQTGLLHKSCVVSGWITFHQICLLCAPGTDAKKHMRFDRLVHKRLQERGFMKEEIRLVHILEV